MPDTTLAAFWSAVAASFSALAAFAAILIQRRNMLESVRPEIVLFDWTRKLRGKDESEHEVITFGSVKNVGRGAALHLHIGAMRIIGSRPVAIMSSKQIPILAPNEQITIDGEIVVWWKNASPVANGAKTIPLEIQIYAWDSHNMRHTTTYELVAFELGQHHIGPDAVAPGVVVMMRRATSRPVWVLKLCSYAARLPIAGRMFRESV